MAEQNLGVPEHSTQGGYWHPLWTEQHARNKAAVDAWLAASATTELHHPADSPSIAAEASGAGYAIAHDEFIARALGPILGHLSAE